MARILNIVDETEAEAIEEAKDVASRHAGALVVRRDGNPAVGEGEPIVVRFGKTGDFYEGITATAGKRALRPSDHRPTYWR